jgi:hypothetical protein
MRSLYSISLVIGFVLFFGGDNGSSASAKTIEAGDTSTSWNGSGEVQDLVDGHQLINGKVQGMIISRHKTSDGKLVVHTSKLVCPVRVDQKRSADYMMLEGLCTMVAHEGKDIGFGQLEMRGNPEGVQGGVHVHRRIGRIHRHVGIHPF